MTYIKGQFETGLLINNIPNDWTGIALSCRRPKTHVEIKPTIYILRTKISI